jgi:hypothetical protein
MGKAMHEGLQPRCTFAAASRVVSFMVVSSPACGMLELADFRDESS